MNRNIGIYIENGLHVRGFFHSDFIKNLSDLGICVKILTNKRKHVEFLAKLVTNIEVFYISGKPNRISKITNNYLSNSRLFFSESDSYKLRRASLKRNNPTKYMAKKALYLLTQITLFVNLLKTIYNFFLIRSFIFPTQMDTLNGIIVPVIPNSNVVNLINCFCRKNNIPLFYYAVSFDNTSSKLHPFIKADYLFVWNEIQKLEAIKFGGYKNNEIIVSGGIHYDDYINADLIRNKSIINNKYFNGLDEKYVLFGTVNPLHIKDNSIYIKSLLMCMHNAGLNNFKVIIRVHPQTVFISKPNETSEDMSKYENLNDNTSLNIPVIITDEVPFMLDYSDKIELINLIYYSELVVGFSSSLSIDALILNKPVINFGFWLDESDKFIIGSGYDYTHYKKLIASGVVTLPKDEDELQRSITKFLSCRDEDYKKEIADKSKKYIIQQLPNLGNSSKLTAQIVEAKIK